MKSFMTEKEGAKTAALNTGESHKFAGDIIWFSVAQLFVSLILGMITLPALTKSYTSEIYGIWVQVTVTVDLISPLLSLQLGLAVVRFLAGEENKAVRRKALGAMLFAIIAFSGIISALGLIFSKQLSAFLFNSPNYVLYVLFLIIWTFFNALFNFLIAYLRARGKIKSVAIIQVTITVLKMIAIIGLAQVAIGIDSIILSMIVLQVIFAGYILFMVVKEIGFPLPSRAGIMTFLKFSVPQMPVIALLWIISLGDRYFITHFLGLSQNGVYSPSSIIAGLTSLFYAPISFVLFPLLSKLWAQKRAADLSTYFEYSIKFFLTLAIPGAIGITVVSQPLLRLLTTSEFLAGEQIVFLLTLGAIFLGIYQISTNLILLDKQAKLLPVMAAAAAVTNIIMNLILVPRVGILGAAVSNCVSYFVLAGITILWTRKTARCNYDLKYIGKVVLSSAAMLLSLIFLKSDSIWDIALSIIVGAAVFGAALFILRAFSQQEKYLIKKTVAGFFSR